MSNKVKCLICGKEFDHLGNHVYFSHGIKLSEYRERFNLTLDDTRTEQSKKNIKLASKEVHSRETWKEAHGKAHSKWMLKNWDKTYRTAQRSLKQSISTKIQWENPEYRQKMIEVGKKVMKANLENPDFLEKRSLALMNGHAQRKSYTLCNGEKVLLRSNNEFRVYNILIKYNINAEYETLRIHYTDDQNKNRLYIPDFYIPDKNLILEVKGSNLYQQDKLICDMKMKKCLDLGYNYSFIFDNESEEHILQKIHNT